MADIAASDLSKCEDEVPLLGVSREFDFGQFIELFDSTEDARDPTRPVLARIVIQPSATLASDRNAVTGAPTESTASPIMAALASAPMTSDVQLRTREPEVDLFDLVEHGPGAKMAPIEVQVIDKETFFKEGTVEIDGETYKVPLEASTRNAMTMGLSLTTFAQPLHHEGKIPLRISLPFHPMKLTQDGLAQILAGSDLESAGFAGYKPRLTPTAVRTLLSDVAVLTHAIGPKGQKMPVKLIPPSSDDSLIGNRFQVFDLPAFIAAPFILTKNGAPLAVKLTSANVRQLISTGRTQINVGSSIELTVLNDENSPEFLGYISVVAQLQNVYGSSISVKPSGVSWDDIIGLGPTVTKSPLFVHPLLPDADSGLGTRRPADRYGYTGSSMAPLKSMTDKVQPRLPTGTGLPVAVFVPWKQTWTLKGFSRGNLLNTIALAPQEEITMQVYNWERRSRSLEQSAETDISQQTDVTQTTRDTEDVFREMLAKRDFAWQLNGSLDASYSPGVASIKVHADGGVSETNSKIFQRERH